MVGPEGKEPAELRAELMLVATGRAANIEDIGLETTKVETDRGVIKVNGRMRTKEPHVYAIGDIVGGLWLAHTAGARGHHRGAHDRRRRRRPRDGLQRTAAGDLLPAGDRLDRADRGARSRPRASRSRSARSRSRRSPRRSSAASTRASPRSSRNTETDDTLGVHIVGPHATDLIAEASLALRARRDAMGDRRRDPRPPDAVGGHRRGRDGRRRTIDQLLAAGRARPGVTRRPDRSDGRQPERSDSSLGAAVGLTDADLVEMYRLVALARAVDERMWILNRAGRIPFVISGQGHEGAQVGIAWAFQKGHDWIAPFYRSIATCLTFGMSPRDILTAQYATANDPSSGGRQMPGHYGSHEHNLVSVSSPVATQLLHAVGIALAAKIRKTGQVAMTSMGEGQQQPGRRPRGPQLRGDPQAAVHLRRREQRLRHQRPGRRASWRVPNVADRAAGYGIPGVVVDGVGRARLLRGGARRRRAGPRRRRPDAHRGQGHPPDRPLLGRPADQVPLGGGARRRARARRAAALPRPAARRRRPDRRDRGADSPPTSRPTVDDATDYAESQPDPDPATAPTRFVYADGTEGVD